MNIFELFLDNKNCQQKQDAREHLLALMSSALLKNYQFNKQSTYISLLIITLEKVAIEDPEFILQLAYYTRNGLKLKSPANFLLAFAIQNKSTKQYCKQYFNETIILPTDLVEVCKLSQIGNFYFKGKQLPELFDIRLNLKFSNLLQNLVRQKFPEFTIYQLGKYCSEAKRKRNIFKYKLYLKKIEVIEIKNDIKQDFGGQIVKQLLQQNEQGQITDGKLAYLINSAHEEQELKKQNSQFEMQALPNAFAQNFLNIKEIVQMCHIKEPKYIVNSITGYKYPKTQEEFEQKYPNQTIPFDINKVGKRMSIPIPITWDRQLSQANSKDKTQIWEELILNDNIPYQALIRNLRNILKANISDNTHAKVINMIQNPRVVEIGKVSPLQYFMALNEIKTFIQADEKQYQNILESRIMKKIKKIQYVKKFQNMQKMYSLYMDSIETAMNIAVEYNLDAISGRTIIFIDASDSMLEQLNLQVTEITQYTYLDAAIILGYLIRKKCESCKVYVFSSSYGEGPPYFEINFQDDTLLQGINRCKKTIEKLGGVQELIGQTLKEVLLDKKVICDNVIILSDMMITQGFMEGKSKYKMSTVIKQYIAEVSYMTKFYFIDLSSNGYEINLDDELRSQNCYLINGYNEHILKYIKATENINQIDDVKQYYIIQQKLNIKKQMEQQIKQTTAKEQEISNENLQQYALDIKQTDLKQVEIQQYELNEPQKIEYFQINHEKQQ